VRAADSFPGGSAEEKRIGVTQNKISSGSIEGVVLGYPANVGQRQKRGRVGIVKEELDKNEGSMEWA